MQDIIIRAVYAALAFFMTQVPPTDRPMARNTCHTSANASPWSVSHVSFPPSITCRWTVAALTHEDSTNATKHS